MAKLIIGSVVAITSGAGIALSEPGLGGAPIGDGSVRNLLLNAAGTRTAKPGEIRIPIQVDGVEYEVIGIAPGEPKAAPVARSSSRSASPSGE